MFEFHGWATIRIPGESEYRTIGRGAEYDAVKRLRDALNQAHDECSAFDILYPGGNSAIVLSAHGLRNHRYEPVLDLFRWVAAELPHSYGLLYVRDDEDFRRQADFSDEFRAWRLARGRFEEMADSFLSPFDPTVGDVDGPGDPG